MYDQHKQGTSCVADVHTCHLQVNDTVAEAAHRQHHMSGGTRHYTLMTSTVTGRSVAYR